MSKTLTTAGLIVLFIAVGFLFILQFRTGDKYVYVDSVKLVNGYEGMKTARLEFETKTSAWRANLDTLRLEMENKVKEYNGSKARLSAGEKKLMEELIQSKQEQFMNYQQIISEKIQKEDNELTTKVLGKVNDYIKRYGKDRGFTIIMAATQYGNIIYAKDEADITEEVLEGLNKEYN